MVRKKNNPDDLVLTLTGVKSVGLLQIIRYAFTRPEQLTGLIAIPLHLRC